MSQVELWLGHVEAIGFAVEPASQLIVERKLSQSLQP